MLTTSPNLQQQKRPVFSALLADPGLLLRLIHSVSAIVHQQHIIFQFTPPNESSTDEASSHGRIMMIASSLDRISQPPVYSRAEMTMTHLFSNIKWMDKSVEEMAMTVSAHDLMRAVKSCTSTDLRVNAPTIEDVYLNVSLLDNETNDNVHIILRPAMQMNRTTAATVAHHLRATRLLLPGDKEIPLTPALYVPEQPLLHSCPLLLVCPSLSRFKSALEMIRNTAATSNAASTSVQWTTDARYGCSGNPVLIDCILGRHVRISSQSKPVGWIECRASSVSCSTSVIFDKLAVVPKRRTENSTPQATEQGAEWQVKVDAKMLCTCLQANCSTDVTIRALCGIIPQQALVLYVYVQDIKVMYCLPIWTIDEDDEQQQEQQNDKDEMDQ